MNNLRKQYNDCARELYAELTGEKEFDDEDAKVLFLGELVEEFQNAQDSASRAHALKCINNALSLRLAVDRIPKNLPLEEFLASQHQWPLPDQGKLKTILDKYHPA